MLYIGVAIVHSFWHPWGGGGGGLALMSCGYRGPTVMPFFFQVGAVFPPPSALTTMSARLG